ncbi:MAG: hypothetical protein OEP48_05695 [Betaproteobacteria bacterium]|nr:hypothetical protein [Betaproteobacteria bacterium]MDH3437692.1 hypothetical protein [Betaproteobacteria bacterium]
MVQMVAGAKALRARRMVKSMGTGEEHWRTDFIGQRGEGVTREEPQAFLIEMSPNEVIVPHFHEVDQFQVFVSGSGSLGRQAAAGPLAVHYADHHTGYGPINASAQGFSYFTLRARTDPGAVYLHKPGYRERLKPSKKRHGVADGIPLSTEPVLMSRKEIATEKLLGDLDGSDGLAASLIRMGPGMTLAGPDPVATGGQHYLVVNGSLEIGGGEYAAWSTVFVPATDPALELRAGPKGLEVLLLQYPRKSVTGDE